MTFFLASHRALRRPSPSNDAHCRTMDRSEATLQRALASTLLRPTPAIPSPPLPLLTLALRSPNASVPLALPCRCPGSRRPRPPNRTPAMRTPMPRSGENTSADRCVASKQRPHLLPRPIPRGANAGVGDESSSTRIPWVRTPTRAASQRAPQISAAPPGPLPLPRRWSPARRSGSPFLTLASPSW